MKFGSMFPVKAIDMTMDGMDVVGDTRTVFNDQFNFNVKVSKSIHFLCIAMMLSV